MLFSGRSTGVATVNGPIPFNFCVCPAISVFAVSTAVIASRSAWEARAITASVSGAALALCRMVRASWRKSAMMPSTFCAARELVACASDSTCTYCGPRSEISPIWVRVVRRAGTAASAAGPDHVDSSACMPSRCGASVSAAWVVDFVSAATMAAFGVLTPLPSEARSSNSGCTSRATMGGSTFGSADVVAGLAVLVETGRRRSPVPLLMRASPRPWRSRRRCRCRTAAYRCCIRAAPARRRGPAARRWTTPPRAGRPPR